MQIGTRWGFGDTPPQRLPEAVVSAITSIEEELAEQGVDTESWGWTLTWLEGNPIVELDDGTVITYDRDEDTATVA